MSKFVYLYYRINTLSDLKDRLIYCDFYSRLKERINQLENRMKLVLGERENSDRLLEDIEKSVEEAEEWVETTSLYFKKEPPQQRPPMHKKNSVEEREISFAAQLIIQQTFSQWADFSEKEGKGYFLHLLFFQCRCSKTVTTKKLFVRCEPRKCVTFHRGLRIIIECLLTEIKTVRITVEKDDINVMFYALRYLNCSKRFIRELLKNVKFEVRVLTGFGKVGFKKWGMREHYLTVPEIVTDLFWIPLCMPSSPSQQHKQEGQCCRAPTCGQSLDPKMVSAKETLARMESFLDPRRGMKLASSN